MDTRPANDTALHIGNRIVTARLLCGLSPDFLANKLGVTLEQLQMYEAGENLSAERLYHVARVLKLDVSYFYEGLKDATSCPFSLSNDRYMLLRRAVLRIAADYEVTRTGHRKKLARHEAINVAREVCEVLGWNYGKAGVSLKTE